MSDVVIEARGLEKKFRIPAHRVDSFKERVVHPLARTEYRELHALKRIDLDVHRGEFFGVVGRNGSGKSTLLKILASIYRADAGTILMAGRVAPFIELGVGFNPDLTARENVVLNGVMMGLSRREASSRLGSVLEFAELEEFVDMKLKNYSSGMLVRLAFSVMIQSDSDILLIDEVLAVGDAAFQRKCMAVFDEMRDSDRTVVLVTHDMGVVQSHCHRAMLLEQGEAVELGDPQRVGREYLRVNFNQLDPAEDDASNGDFPDIHVRVEGAGLEDAAGRRIERLPPGEPLRVSVALEALRGLRDPQLIIYCSNSEDIVVFELERDLVNPDDSRDRIDEGERMRIAGTIENPLQPGQYTLRGVVTRTGDSGGRAVQAFALADFDVAGRPAPGDSLVSVGADLAIASEGRDG
jgi:ABC-type polysaccharide/polyol phosphate transport system ATPase subunit